VSIVDDAVASRALAPLNQEIRNFIPKNLQSLPKSSRLDPDRLIGRDLALVTTDRPRSRRADGNDTSLRRGLGDFPWYAASLSF
jgi:hypothetical protein